MVLFLVCRVLKGLQIRLVGEYGNGGVDGYVMMGDGKGWG